MKKNESLIGAFVEYSKELLSKSTLKAVDFLCSCAVYRSASALGVGTVACLRNYLTNGTEFITTLPQV